MKKWAVIGAGPAGIASVAKLLDYGISNDDIVWFDPEFKVGDLGTKWCEVSSNTKVENFLEFLSYSQSFQLKEPNQQFAIYQFDPDQTCQLKHIVEPLQWITESFKKIITSITASVESLELINNQWQIHTPQQTYFASNVVLAIGAEPNYLSYDVPMISLANALDKNKLSQLVTAQDSVAVFGSSHSAILILRDLINLNVKRVINFYRSPERYAVYMNNWILFDNTGLKGDAADWAKENLNNKKHANLQRYLSTTDNIHQYLPSCNKVIYATGFKPRHINVPHLAELEYNDKTGIIAPGLFGIGIAFPEGACDKFNNFEYNVGLRKFIRYLDRIMPIWLQYGI